MDRLRARIVGQKRYPRAAQRRRLEGEGELRLRVAADGALIEATLTRSSDHAVLDAEILAMARRAAPFPAIPARLGRSSLEIVLPVRFDLR
ncbi:MAG: TonB family protein [Paracoccaceae bacterium]